MGALSSLATGVLGGVVSGKQYKDRAAREEKWDTMMAPIYKKLAGVTDTTDTTKTATKPATDAVVEEKANGGIVSAAQPMPQHYDRTSWQRQSFKKDSLKPATDMFGDAVVTVTRIK